jgi:outer membrane protein assembly factor BamD
MNGTLGRLRTPIGLAAALGLLAGLLSGCGLFHEEFAPTDPVGIYALAREHLEAERYEEAQAQFERVLESAPDNEVRLQALMSLADTFYKNGQYEEAQYHYRKFLQLYPLHPLAPRAQFQLAMCSFAQIRTPDRDQSSTREALRQFERFIQTYPDHPLVTEAAKRRDFCLQRLAEHDMIVARFYFQQGKYHATITRLKTLLEEYPRFNQRDEALYLLGQSYKQEESLEKARASFARLLADHPQSPYAKSAKKILARWQKRGS